jgi:hypothetical protein
MNEGPAVQVLQSDYSGAINKPHTLGVGLCLIHL